MRVLVTGASGMLGRELALALAARGDRVTVMQRRPSGLGLAEVLGDVADPSALTGGVSGQDVVVHAAAKVDMVGRWPDYVRTNIDGTRAVVRACQQQGVSRLVYVSSPSVAHVGDALQGQDAGIADPDRAHGPYARSKAAAELIALRADHGHVTSSGITSSDVTSKGPLSVVAIRPHLVWGPGDTQLIGRIVERARAGRLPLIGSGAALIDTTYVSNAVEALIAAVDRCEVVHGQALVVTNGEPRPVAELLGEIGQACGVPPPSRTVPKWLAMTAGGMAEAALAARIRLGAAPPDQPPLTRFLVTQLSTAHWFDQRRTRELLDWSPRVSIEQGLARLRAAQHQPSAP